jgi:hypothetical protein
MQESGSLINLVSRLWYDHIYVLSAAKNKTCSLQALIIHFAETSGSQSVLLISCKFAYGSALYVLYLIQP